ncbi:MAG: anhydro-N-acetylmuramic acid kinase, partial [Vicinamibacteria bacterium]
MSGTSMDSVDAALLEFRGHGIRTRFRLLGFASRPYPAELRRSLLRLA